LKKIVSTEFNSWKHAFRDSVRALSATGCPTRLRKRLTNRVAGSESEVCSLSVMVTP